VKRILLLLSILFISANTGASTDVFDAKQFAQKYFNAWKATQSPQATKSDIQSYLSLLKDDVGHQHLPYDPQATRELDGKQRIMEGMLYYLGTHTEYAATLATIVAGYQVVVIKYNTQLAGKHPQTGEFMTLSYDTVEVLEIEDGKVAVIRKYSE